METYSIATFLTITIALSYAFYKYLNRNFDYFVRRGVKGPKPEIIFGTGREFLKRPVHEIAKTVLVKEFNLFRNRIKLPSQDPLLQKMMFFADNEEWKRLRSITSPTFTSGKIKKMYPLIGDCLQEFIKHLRNGATEEKEINLKKAYGAFTMDVIARCAFATKIKETRKFNTLAAILFVYSSIISFMPNESPVTELSVISFANAFLLYSTLLRRIFHY